VQYEEREAKPIDGMTLSEEKAWMTRAKEDPEAFGRVFDAQFPAIFSYLLHRTADAALAEDLAAKTFFNALRYVRRFRWSGVSVSSWLYRIAMNEVNSHLRKRRPLALDAFSDRLVDHRPGPEEALMRAEAESEFLEVHACIDRLKPDEQNLIVLRYFEDMPYAGIAAITGKKEGSLRMRTMRALEKLRKIFLQKGLDDERAGRLLAGGTETRREVGFVPEQAEARSP
jgi:RNA polymerase sigma-70 factor (ECF subfamily)